MKEKMKAEGQISDERARGGQGGGGDRWALLESTHRNE